CSASDQQLIHQMAKTLSCECDHVNRMRGGSAQGGPQRAVEVPDVLAGELGHRVLAAVEDRLEQVDVLADVPDEIGDPGDDEAPDPRGQVVESNERLHQVRVVDRAIDEPVDVEVEFHQSPLIIGGLERPQLGDRGLELRTTLGREVPGRLAGGDRLEHFAHLGDRGQVGEVDGAGERSAPGEGDDQVVALESLERFADGGPPDFELLAQGRLVDGVTGGDVEHDESVAKDL